MTMKCPRCEAEVEGRFCGFCGAPLEARPCPGCESSVPPGYRFCGECGLEQTAGVRATAPGAAATPPREFSHDAPAPSPGPARHGEGEPADWESAADAPPVTTEAPDRRGWWALGAAVVGGLLFLAIPYVWTGWADPANDPRVPMGASTGLPGPGPAPGVDLSTMTPREAADRLFNRVMTALGEGDQSEVGMFLPMAIDAYQLVPNLDADGHFHLSLLQQAGGDHRGGLQTAERVLDTNPDHLLALYAAGEAARELGESAWARDHFQHVLEVFETESARDLPEYREHAGLLPAIRETAEDYLRGGT